MAGISTRIQTACRASSPNWIRPWRPWWMTSSIGVTGKTPSWYGWASLDGHRALNQNAGRDHWPRCWSVVVGGGAIKGGQVIGTTTPMALVSRTTSTPLATYLPPCSRGSDWIPRSKSATTWAAPSRSLPSTVDRSRAWYSSSRKFSEDEGRHRSRRPVPSAFSPRLSWKSPSHGSHKFRRGQNRSDASIRDSLMRLSREFRYLCRRATRGRPTRNVAMRDWSTALP